MDGEREPQTPVVCHPRSPELSPQYITDRPVGARRLGKQRPTSARLSAEGQLSATLFSVDKSIEAVVNAQAESVIAALLDLMTYQHWLDLVDHVEPASAVDGDAGPAYHVTLIAKIGPFARRKRLRMVRAQNSEYGATFERNETDGRSHSTWVLEAHAREADPTVVTMRLAYGGGLWSDVLETVLDNQIARAADSLAAYVHRAADR